MTDFKIIKNNMNDLIKTSLPLILSMMSGLIMMLVDRLCLSRYSENTLAASGPAIYNSITIITFFVGIVGISRVFVGQSYGKKDEWNIAISAASGIIIALVLGIIFILLKPLIMFIPELGGRTLDVKDLEIQFMSLVPYYGFFMIVSASMASILNGVLKTKETMAVGIIGNVINAIFTIILVYGLFGLKELGIKGSPYGTLIATSIQTLIYIILLSKSQIFKPLYNKRDDKAKKIKEAIMHILKIGIPSGAAQALDEAGQAAFVWIVGSVSFIGLISNNIALTINYIIIIPLIGLGIGTSIIVSNKIGSGENEKTLDVLKGSILLSFIYIAIMTILELIFAPEIISPFMPYGANQEIINSSTSVVKVLFTYAIGFSLSMIMSGALDAVGLSKYVFWLRVVIIFGISLPIIYFIVSRNMGNSNIVTICWIIGSIFELILGVIYGAIFFKIGYKKQALI